MKVVCKSWLSRQTSVNTASHLVRSGSGWLSWVLLPSHYSATAIDRKSALNCGMGCACFSPWVQKWRQRVHSNSCWLLKFLSVVHPQPLIYPVFPTLPSLLDSKSCKLHQSLASIEIWSGFDCWLHYRPCLPLTCSAQPFSKAETLCQHHAPSQSSLHICYSSYFASLCLRGWVDLWPNHYRSLEKKLWSAAYQDQQPSEYGELLSE